MRNTFFNYVASDEHPVAAGDCLLHNMHSGKEKSEKMSHRPSLLASRKHYRLLNFWNVTMKRNLTMTKSSTCSSIPSPRIISMTTFIMVTMTLIPRPWKTSRISSNAIMIPLHPNNLIIVPTKAKPPILAAPFSLIVIMTLNLLNTNPPSCCSNDQPCKR